MYRGRSLIVASAVVVGLLVAPPAHADDTQDQIYLTSLGNRGVSCASLPGCGGNDQLLGLGQALCKDMAIRFDPALEANSLIANQGFTKEQAAVVVGSAIGAYCPQFLGALHQQAAGN
ncbi:MAG: DUF732 domain-containing protein [Mycobacterium sp.]|nr:DUF732 domain-containing protein [Mycobacterium sp.]